jgi:hypothetical protein
VRQERALVGTVAAIMAGSAATAFASGNVLLGAPFAVLAVLALVATFASLLPVFHLLPFVGAVRPPEIEFHLEAPPSGMAFDIKPGAEARVLLCAGVLPEGRRDEITRVTVNAYVVGATNIVRTEQDGTPYENGGRRLTGPDAPYWSISSLTIPLGPFLMFFKVTIPDPGEYEVVLSLQSPDFHDKGDHVHRATLIARSRTAVV